MAETGGGAVGRGISHPGYIRPKNEDRYFVDDSLGLYAVFDGMGGHSGGDIAAALAREVVVRYVAERRHRRTPRKLLERAFQRASSAVHREAQRRGARDAMGTTAVAVMVTPDRKAALASVGDSRAYLVRDGTLRLLTRDQTVVNELVASGSLTPEAAASHPYRSVLSNNIGARPRTHVQLAELLLGEGDRLLLCSDGLTGFASAESIAAIALGAADPERAAEDLIQVALDGGGGDNVTAVVVDIAPVVPRSTGEVRRRVADAWWRRREQLGDAATSRGLAVATICQTLPGCDAGTLAAQFAAAARRDLEEAGGDAVGALAERLATAWMDQGGGYAPVIEVLDGFRGAASEVVASLRGDGDPLAESVAAGLYRALTAAEGAVGRLVAKRLRAIHEAAESARRDERRREADLASEAPPLELGAPRAPSSAEPVLPDPPEPAVGDCLTAAVSAARGELGSPAEQAVLECGHRIATESLPAASRRELVRELWGNGELDEATVARLIATMDRAREAHLAALRRAPGSPEARAVAMTRGALAHYALAAALAGAAVDAGRDISERLAARSAKARDLRTDFQRGEARLDRLEETLATLSGQAIDTLVSEGGEP